MVDMRERKYVKFRIDMYEDTKSKIIDMKPERDLIHYVWNRFVILAGKVNLEGDLYMSKNIPYTVETLAIEFNRGTYHVKLALDVLIELEMIELTENNVYRVKNFAKHQNIKVKEKIKVIDKEEVVTRVVERNINKEISENAAKNVRGSEHSNLEIHNTDINENEKRDTKEIDNKDNDKMKEIDKNSIENTICDEKNNNKLSEGIPIVLEEKRKKQRKKENTIDFGEIEEGDNSIIQFFDGDEVRPLGENDSVVSAWSFRWN
jgi:predicted phage replisome organizer